MLAMFNDVQTKLKEIGAIYTEFDKELGDLLASLANHEKYAVKNEPDGSNNTEKKEWLKLRKRH